MSYYIEINSKKDLKELFFHVENNITASEEKFFNISVVVDELSSNIIKYGFNGSVIINEYDKMYELYFYSSGDPVDKKYVKEKINPEKAHNGKGGLGLLLVRNLSDEFSYIRNNGKNIFKVLINKK